MNAYLIAINAKYIHMNPAVYDLRAYVKSHLSDEALNLQVLEYTINEPLDRILRDIFSHRPDFLAFSCYIWNIQYVKELLSDLHAVLPETPMYLGGPEVSYDAPSLCREFPFLSGIMLGEGEQTLTDILRSHLHTDSAENPLAGFPSAAPENLIDCSPSYPDFPAKNQHPVPGLFTPGMKAEEVSCRPCVPMDEIPFFYEEFADDPHLGPFDHKILYYESSRGCPFRCAYCLSSAEKDMRFRSLSLVLKELQFFLDRNVPQVKFIDRTFNAKRSHALAIWNYLKEHDNGVTNFHFEIEPSLLDEEELRLLTTLRPGFFQLEIGVQSTCDEALKAVHRKNDFEKLREITALLKKAHNMHLHLDLIAGLPYETFERFKKSFNDLYLLRPDELQLGFLKVLKGTAIRESCYGEPDALCCRKEPPYEVLYTKWISFEELNRLKTVEEALELYGNSHQFDRTLENFLPMFDSPFRFFEEAGIYLKNHNALFMQTSRIRRYEILYAFLIERYPEREELLRESLAFDFMVRELPKKHFSFFPNGDCIDFKKPSLTLSDRTVIFDYTKKDPVTGNCVYFS